MDDLGHTPVLLEETLDLLAPEPGETALDCTAGRGGHAVEIARRIGPTGMLILNDLDASNLERSEARVRLLPAPPTVEARHGNFADLPMWMNDRGLGANVVLADLGFSSMQVDDPARGFSFRRQGPLDMRFDPSAAETAAGLLQRATEEEIASILREFGEERRARSIARKLVAARQSEPITTTTRLAELVRQAAGPARRHERIDPATRTFQALRIAINDEIGSLERLLDAIARAARGVGGSRLAAGARVGVISFHSLEDRPVKRVFRELVSDGLAEALTRKPLRASEDEQARNPRARSARLRAIRLTRRASGL